VGLCPCKCDELVVEQLFVAEYLEFKKTMSLSMHPFRAQHNHLPLLPRPKVDAK
jgi:hypothetical protein